VQAVAAVVDAQPADLEAGGGTAGAGSTLQQRDTQARAGSAVGRADSGGPAAEDEQIGQPDEV
jgi:hypothetical protein